MLARFISALPTVVDTMAAICRPNKKRTVAKLSARPTAELKYYDVTRAAGTVSGAGTVDPTFANIVAGTGPSNRLGRLITVHEIEVLGNVSVPTTATLGQAWDCFRLMVVQDKQCNGAAYGVTDLLVTGDEKSLLNPLNECRFDILKEALYEVNQGVAIATTGEAGRWFRFKLPVNIVLEYSANAGTVADLRSNNINLFAVTRNGVGVIEYTARLRYTDA